MRTPPLSATTREAPGALPAGEKTTAPSPHAQEKRGVAFMGLSLLCFTANTLLLKYLGAVREIDFSVALIFRAVVGTVIVLALFPKRRPVEFAAIFTDRALIARGFLGLLGTAAFYYTIPVLGAGKATLLCTTYVLFGAI
ncbi:MAG: hypothetical protein ACC661_05365, partial [Verrucomicrobiales bacterium]